MTFFKYETSERWHVKKEKSKETARLTGVKNQLGTFFSLEPHGSSNSKPDVPKIYGLQLQNYKIKFSGKAVATGDGSLQQPLMQAVNSRGQQNWVRY